MSDVGQVTGLALGAVNKLLSYHIIGKLRV